MKSYLVNVILYVVTLLAVLLNLLLIAIPAALIFTYRSNAVWFIPAALLIDGYFGMFYTVPWLNIIAITWFAVAELLRPYVLVQ